MLPPRRFQRLAVVGDLHYEVPEERFFRRARQQLMDLRSNYVVSLGDLGGYSHPGTALSFREGQEFFGSFGVPFRALVGNHDMECPDFATDDDVLAEWCKTLRCDKPYGTFELGTALGICLSQTGFRSNRGSPHEVHIDDEQIAWFEATLAANPRRHTFVFSHAPIMGSNLRVLTDVHLCTPNAYLCHSDRPERFIHIVRANPQIRLWFSAHNHLGQGYPDSLNQAGACLFVHTGVIGSHSRDNAHQSRLVDFDEFGCVLHTVDHATGQCAPDMLVDYASGRTTRLRLPPALGVQRHFPPPPFPRNAGRLQIGNSAFVLYRGFLIEYDVELEAAAGVVETDLDRYTLAVAGEELHATGPSGQLRVFKRWPSGRFMKN